MQTKEEKRRAWRENNKDRLNAEERARWKRNKEAITKKHVEYAKSHPEVVAAAAKRYRNSEKGRAYFAQWNIVNANKRKEYRRKCNSRPEAKESARQRQAEYRKTDKYRVWKEANADRMRANSLAAYYRHREHMKEYQRLYCGPYPRRTAIYAKWDKCDGLCYICGLSLSVNEVHIDHVIPKTKNGTNDINNLMPVHSSCNTKKGNKLDFSVARPDLVEVASCITAFPRKSPRRCWKEKHMEYLEDGAGATAGGMF